MKIEVFADDGSAARAAAGMIAAEARTVVAVRSRFVMAVSGGRTPWIMMRALAVEEVPSQRVHVVQVDERVAPAGHADRKPTHLLESLLDDSPIRPEQIHAMPWNRLTWKRRLSNTPRPSLNSLTRRRRLTSYTWVSGQMDILLLWCPEIRC
jgi:6-phosphogluconolactonase/glucosamine-6-phosphate isomerase/deaminase